MTCADRVAGMSASAAWDEFGSVPGWAALGGALRRPDVMAALAGARDDVDALLWRRDIRQAAPQVAAASIERGARASAAIDGADVVAVDASPMGRVLAAAAAVTAAVPDQVETWERAPLQVMARLHAIAASGFEPSDGLGRPRSTDAPDDPLGIGTPAPTTVLGPRLVALSSLVVGNQELPGIAAAAVVHHELMALRPFAWGSGLVARALVRCVLASRGLDPSCFAIPELGMLDQGRPAYVRAIRDYAAGTEPGLASSIVWFCTSLGMGAQAVEPAP